MPTAGKDRHYSIHSRTPLGRDKPTEMLHFFLLFLIAVVVYAQIMEAAELKKKGGRYER